MVDGIPMCQKHRDEAHVIAMQWNGNTAANGIPGVTKVDGADKFCRMCPNGTTPATWEVFA